MKKKALIILILFLGIASSSAQNKGVAINKNSPESSAILDISSSLENRTGTGAKATATVNANGQVIAITVTNGGSGYANPLTIDIYNAPESIHSGVLSGSEARGIATIVNGVITAISVTNGGAGYVNGSTNVSINSGNLAMILPRVALISTTNNVSPVNNPADGLTVFNPANANVQEGIYTWITDADAPINTAWKRALPVDEVPKSVIVEYSGPDTFILDNAGAGITFGVFSESSNLLVYNEAARDIGLRSVTLNSGNAMKITPGKYKVEITFYITAPAPVPSTQGIQINGNSGYYYMGYLSDIILEEYNLSTKAISNPQPPNTGTFTPFSTRLRKEYGVLSKVDQYHKFTQIYSFNIPDLNNGRGIAFRLSLGRMLGSGHNDQFSYSKALSYIKISQF